MNILILQRFDLSSVSCARRVLCQTEELLQRGHKVQISDFVHKQRQEEVPQTANLSSLGANILPLNREITHFFSNYKTLLSTKVKPDIIHLWKSYPDASLLAYFLARQWNVPLLYDWDDWEQGIAKELTGSALAGCMAGLWDRIFPSLCHSMTVASQYLRQKALKHGTPSTKIWDAPVGADISFFFPRPKNENLWRQLQVSSPLIVYSGQLEVASYAEFTLDILKTVRETIPTAHLLILGGGRKLPAIREKAKTLKIEPYVRFTNYVSGDKIPDYLSLADIALAPFEDNEVTRAKSPLKIVEYLAMGLPVVASHVGEAPIMIGEAGNTVPCGDIQGMAEKTVEILSSPDLKSKMNQKARIIAETTYNWKSHVDSLEKAYDYALRSFHS